MGDRSPGTYTTARARHPSPVVELAAQFRDQVCRVLWVVRLHKVIVVVRRRNSLVLRGSHGGLCDCGVFSVSGERRKYCSGIVTGLASGGG